MYYIKTLKLELVLSKQMSITDLMRRLSSISIDATWRLSLVCLLMRIIESFLRNTGYLNLINGPISRVLLLILVHVYTVDFLPHCDYKPCIKLCTTVYERNGKNFFGSIKSFSEILNKLKPKGF